MKSAMITLSLLVALSLSAQAANVNVHSHHKMQVNPLAKVVTILSEMEAKLHDDAETDEIAFKKYQEWCRVSKRDYEYVIKTTATDKMNALAEIEKAKANIHADQAYLESLAADIMSDNQQVAALAVQRSKEHIAYAEEKAEITDTLDTLDRAINILERNASKTALLQTKFQSVEEMAKVLDTLLDAAQVSMKDRKKLTAFAQMHAQVGASEEADDEELAAPAAKLYEAKSTSIIEALEDLEKKGKETLYELNKEESDARSAYELRKQSILNEVADAEASTSSTKAQKAEQENAEASAESDLSRSSADLEANQQHLNDVIQGCDTAVVDYKASQKSRAEEITAIKDAQEVLAGVSSSSEERVYGKPEAAKDDDETSLIQLDDSTEGSHVIRILKALAKKEKSTQLAQLASRVEAVMRLGTKAGEDPFAKVKAMLSTLIDKLESEASAEETHKAWCDKNTAEVTEKIRRMTISVERQDARLEKNQADLTELQEAIQDAQNDLAELLKRSQEMDDARHDEHLAFVKTEADLKQGLNGVRMAINVLHNYYGGASAINDGSEEGAALVDTGSEVLPLRPSHVKAEAAGKDVISMLEIVETDFGKNLAQTQTEEEDATAEYKKQTEIDQKEKIGFEELIKFKNKKVLALNKFVSEGRSDREWANDELESVKEFAKGVHESCDVKAESLEERKARREAEIEGLNQALKALRGEAFLQRRKLRGVH